MEYGGMRVKRKSVWWVMVIIGVLLLSGCQKAQTAQPIGGGAASVPASDGQADAVPNLELDNVSRLAVGTLKLEGSDNAVTPQQATKLLSLWKLVQGGTLTSDAETTAVVKQIEGQMTETQLAAIDALGLTAEDMMTWMQEQGIAMAAAGGAPGDGQGAPAGMPEMSDEERTQMRERFENLSEEERAKAMAEGGFQRPEGAPEGQGMPEGQTPGGGQPGGGVRSGNMILQSLIALLTERAAR